MTEEAQPQGVPVELGDRTYHLVPQRIGRIKRKLGAIFSLFSEQASGGVGSMDVSDVGGSLYDVLNVFIPDLSPKWKLEGYKSEEAAEADEYDEAADASPTPPQIIDALEKIAEIHGIDRLRRVFFALVSPEAIRRYLDSQVRVQATRTLEQEGQRLGSAPSPASVSSPQPNGGSDPTSSGTNAPTPPQPASEVSPLSG